MKKVTKIKFRELCGGKDTIKASSLNTYILRRNVIIDGDDMIDIHHPINSAFINKRLNLVEKKELMSESVPIKPKRKSPSKKPTSHPFESDSQKEEESFDYNDIEQKDVNQMSAADLMVAKDRQQLLKLMEETEIKKIQKEKLLGHSIPTDLVRMVLSRQSKTITNTYAQSCNEIVLTLVHRLGGTLDDSAMAKKEIIEKINAAVKESYDVGLKEIDSIVSDYSEVRTRGEKRT